MRKYQNTNRSLRTVLVILTESEIIPRISVVLSKSVQSAVAALRDAVLAEIPAFVATGNPDVMPQLAQHASEHIQEILRLFSGGEVGDFQFVHGHAQHRAEQHFPLEATLHAYRCGHKIVSRWLRDAVVGIKPNHNENVVSVIADFAIEYTNAISSIMTSEYVSHARLLAEAEGDLRTELLSILLSGCDESDGRVAQLLKRTGYLEQRQSYCVVTAQAVNAVEMQNTARAQRIVSAIAEAASGTSIRVLTGIRNNFVTAILSDKRRQSGWTAAQADLTERILPRLLILGPAVLIGISADHPSTSFLQKALHEAMIAIDFASVANRVVRFRDLPIRDLLIRRGSEHVQSAQPAWVDIFSAANIKTNGALVQTLRAVAEADINVQKAARILGKHPNTVYLRIERIKEITGLDGQHYHDLTELLLAADCWQI